MVNIEEHLRVSREWKERNKEKVRSYRKKYYEANKKRTAAYNKQWAIDNHERVLESRRNYSSKKRYPEKILARTRLNTAVLSGKIAKKVCEVCGESKSYAHHFNGYDSRSWLDVQWLCSRHHTEVHQHA